MAKVLRSKTVSSSSIQSSSACKVGSVSSLHLGRPYLTLSFVSKECNASSALPFENLAAKAVHEQEAAMIVDLLFVFQGIEGENVRLQSADVSDDESVKFAVNPTVGSAIREACLRILPIAGHYDIVVRFIETYSSFAHGQVSQAFCGGMRSVLYDYHQLIFSLERENCKGLLSLQKLWFFVQPLLQSMQILSTLCTTVRRTQLKGGSILSLLYQKVTDFIGDRKSQDLCIYLLQKASEPFFRMLEQWLHSGRIKDCFGEFMVGERATSRLVTFPQKADVIEDFDFECWFSSQYFLRKQHIPGFLQEAADEILDCGKYLNIIFSCGEQLRIDGLINSLSFEFESSTCVDAVTKAYDLASKALVTMLLNKFDLVGHFRSFKHYFLIDKGDFLLQFLETAESELEKPVDAIIPHKLNMLLDQAIRTSTVASDIHKECLSFKLERRTLSQFLLHVIGIGTSDPATENKNLSSSSTISGIEAFCFDYAVKWPMSLIFTFKTMNQYAMIFRRLLFCKYVERLLGHSWMHDRDSPATALRQRMLAFVQTYVSYATMEVIEPNFAVLLKSIVDACSINDLNRYHSDFLDNCSKDCMLTNHDLVCIVDQLLQLCVAFCAPKTAKSRDYADMTVRFDSLLDALFVTVTSQGKEWLSMASRLDMRIKISRVEH